MGNCDGCEEINGVLGRATESLDLERERYEREREVIALGVVELERLSDEINLTLRRMRSRLSGLTPSGKQPN